MRIRFDIKEDEKNNIIFLTNAEGNDVIRAPLLNKGTAFTKKEREDFGIDGLIPPRILTIDQQIEIVHRRFHRLGITLDLCKNCQNIYSLIEHP